MAISSTLRTQCPQLRNVTCASQKRPVTARKSNQSAPKEVVVGIDLGTTNSAISYMKAGKPICIPNADGDTITPSVLCIASEGEVTVGTDARRQSVRNPLNTFYSVKRLIGRKFKDPAVQSEIPRLAFEVVEDKETGLAALKCENVEEGQLLPEDVSAQILGSLLNDARRHTGCEVKKAVISVPAYFNDTQREATMNAGRLAGLEVVRLLREPVAAALAYGLSLSEDQTVLVFDLGGGTYDISLLEVGGGTIEVLSAGGDPHLGGDDWDQAIVDWLLSTHLKKSNLNLNDPRILANLKRLAESAKIALSENEEVALRLPIGGPNGGPFEVAMTRDDLETCTNDLWRRARLPLDQACWQAGIDLGGALEEFVEKQDEMERKGVASWKRELREMQEAPLGKSLPITTIICVGGATRMPAVTRFLENTTGITPLEAAIDPDEAVALGAAVQAGILQGEVHDMMVIDSFQGSLMRALAQMKIKQSPEVLEAAEAKVAERKSAPKLNRKQRRAAALKEKTQQEGSSEEDGGAVTVEDEGAGNERVESVGK